MKKLFIVSLVLLFSVSSFVSRGQGLGNIAYGKILGSDNSPHDLECSHADASGNIYLAGESNFATNYAIAFGALGAPAISAPTGSNYFFYMLKYDANGALTNYNFLYANSTALSIEVNVRGITTDNSGNIYITGYFNGTVDFDATAGTTNLVSTSGSTFLAKYNSSFGLVWAKNFGSSNVLNKAVPEDIAISPTTGNIWIAGYFLGNTSNGSVPDLDPDASTVSLTGYLATPGGFASAYNPSTGAYVVGSLTTHLWNDANNTAVPAVGDYVKLTSIAINSLGKVIVAGNANHSHDGIAGTCNMVRVVTGPFISSFDPGTATCLLQSVAISTINDIEIDASNNVYAVGSDAAQGALVKFNSALTQQWIRNPGANINSLAIDNGGLIYVAGNNSSIQPFVQKFNASGTTQFGGAAGYTLTGGIGFKQILISGNNIVLGGEWGFSQGNPIDIGFDDDVLTVAFPNTSTSQAHQHWGIYYLDNVGATGTITTTASNPTKVSPIPITVTFDEPITGYIPTDHDIINATITNVVQVNNKTFTFDLVPIGQGEVSYQLFTGMFTDYHNNLNTGSNLFSRIYDTVAPTIIIASTSSDPLLSLNAFPITIDFSETMLGFIPGDVTVTNGTMTSIVGSGTHYDCNITPDGAGTVTVKINANMANDAATNGNTASNTLSRLIPSGDTTPPTITISSTSSNPTNITPIPVTFTFNEVVTGFVVGDIGVVNGSAGTFAGSGTTYTANITPTGQGTVTVSVAANVATDAAANGNTAATNLTRVFDNVAPTVVISSTTSSTTSVTPIPVTITFSESVTGFLIGDIGVSGGSAGNFAGSGTTYTADITPTAPGTVTVSVAANVASDAATNGNTIATNLVRTYTTADTTPPTIIISSTSSNPTNVTPIPVTFTFNEVVTGFVVGDIGVVNGSAGTFAGSGTTYTANITPTGQGTVTVSVAANVATDAATNGNTAATNLVRTFDNIAPTVVISSSASGTTSVSPIPVTITFNETVTGFVAGDIVVGNGTAGNFAGSGAVYTADITPSGSGVVTVNVGSSVAVDGAANGNAAAAQFSITYSAPSGTTQFATSVIGFSSQFTTTSYSAARALLAYDVYPVLGDNANAWAHATMDGQREFIKLGFTTPMNVFKIEIYETFAPGAVDTVYLRNASTGLWNQVYSTSAAAATAVARILTINITQTAYLVDAVRIAMNSPAVGGWNEIDAVAITGVAGGDTTPPSVVITSVATDPTKVSPIPVTITFSESVTGFVVGDIGVTNGTAGTFAGSGTTYTANITPSGQGTVTVSVAANVATDAATNGNTAATNLTRVFDNVAPTVIISSTATDPTKVTPIPITITFSESVTGFVVGDIGVVNGSAGTFAGSGTTYTANITPSGQGTVTVSVAANVATDAATNGNTAATNLIRVFDSVAPTVTVSSTASDPTSTSPIPVTITFSESVTGFVVGDIGVVNGTAGTFAGSGTTYTANITPSGQGTVTVSVAANVANDAATNGNTAATNLTRVFDNVAPTVIISSSANDPTNSVMPITITFSESVTGFVVGDIGVVNGSAGTFAGSGTTYTANITPTGAGTVTVSVAANVANDAATNGNTAATNLTRVFDNVAPTVTITSSAADPTSASPIPVTITFSESVIGFVVSDISVTNGTAGNLAGSGTTYTADITPSGVVTVSVSVAAAKATDAALNNNSASNTLTRAYNNTSPTVTISSTASEPTSGSPIAVTVTFSENMTGFVVSDIIVTNGSAGSFSGSGTTYTANVTPTGQGAVTVSVAANSAINGASVGNTPSNLLTRTFDTVLPTVMISSTATDPTKVTPIPITITFSESVTGFVVGDIGVVNGSASAFAGSGTTYTTNITPTGQGTVTVSVAANVAADAATNGNTAAVNLTRVFDNVAPTVTITSSATDPTSVSPIPVTITFSESVTGFVVGDISVTNGSAGNFAGSGTTYTADITPSGVVTVSVSVAASKANDAATNGNAISNTLSRIFNNAALSNQVITFDVISNKTFGDPNFSLAATASSALTVSYASSNNSVATVSGNSVTIVGTGTTIITASQPGDASYNPASDVDRTLTVNKASQTIAFNALSDKALGDAPFELTATASSGLTVSYVSSNTAVATVSGSTVTIIGVGSTTITASQAGNVNYMAAVNVDQNLVVSTVQGQTITFAALPAKIFGDADFALTATASSGLTVSYSSSNTAVATVSGNTVTIIGAGSTIITASQSGNGSFSAASSVDQTLTVSKANQTITFNSLPDKNLGDATYILTATASSGLTVSFTSSTNSVATISGNTVTILGAGSTTITASQPGNANYNAAPSVDQVQVVKGKQDQTITFADISAKTIGDPAFTISATASSNLAVAFSTSSDKITVSGNQVTIVKAGLALVKANQGGNTTFNAAPEVTKTFCINPAKPIITVSGENTESPVLTSSSATGNQWFLNGTAIASATNATFSVAVAGSYTVQTTVETCQGAMSSALPVIITGDISTVKAEAKLYPNPAESNLYLSWPKSSGASSIAIYQMDGKPVEKITTEQSELELGITSYAQGNYLVVIKTDKSNHHLKFFKK